MRRRKLAPLLGGGVVATLLSKSPVLADPFGQDPLPGTGPLADDSLHDYCFTNLAEWGTADGWADNAMSYLANVTDMTTQGWNDCIASDDVWFDLAELSGTTRGRQSCRVAIDAAGACGSNKVEVDPGEILIQAAAAEGNNWPAAYERNMRKTLQHEVGHSVGMTHYGSATADLEGNGAPLEFTLCMVSGHVTNESSLPYSQHHKDHVNNAY